MADSNVRLPWTDDHWNRIRRVVHEEARTARVAGNFLPLPPPPTPDATYVSQEHLIEPNAGPDDQVPGFKVDDTTTLRLSTLQVKVFLRSAQVEDPALGSALIAFRRGANVLAHLEDEIIFRGQPGPDEGPKEKPGKAPPWEVRGGQGTAGLLRTHGTVRPSHSTSKTVPSIFGERLVSDVSRAVGELERRYHLGPFACVLGHRYFQAVQSPDNSLELPQDRILPFLGGGPLVRSSAVPDEGGLLIALGGAPIDLVRSADISIEFLQVTPEAWFVFRLYEKMVLRISQPDAIEPISVRPRRAPRRKQK